MGTHAGAFGPDFSSVFEGFSKDDVKAELRRHLGGLAMTGRRQGRGPWGGPHWGPPPWAQWGPGAGASGPRGRAPRGNVRSAILALLAEEPRHGYQLMQDIAERSHGSWKPSPGSVYPVLSALQDEGLVDDNKVEGRRVFALTDAGRIHVADRADELGRVFDDFSAEEESEITDMRQLMFSVGSAAVQVLTSGTPAQTEQARTILAQTRRDLYAVLAEDSSE